MSCGGRRMFCFFDGRWLRVNRKLSDMLEYSASELLERTIVDITHPADREEDVEIMEALSRMIPEIRRLCEVLRGIAGMEWDWARFERIANLVL